MLKDFIDSNDSVAATRQTRMSKAPLALDPNAIGRAAAPADDHGSTPRVAVIHSDDGVA